MPQAAGYSTNGREMAAAESKRLVGRKSGSRGTGAIGTLGVQLGEWWSQRSREKQRASSTHSGACASCFSKSLSLCSSFHLQYQTQKWSWL